jgi:chitinase
MGEASQAELAGFGRVLFNAREYWPNFIYVIVLLLLTVSAEAKPARKAPHEFRVVGYVTRWTKIESIDATKLTHIIYAFAKVRGDDNVVFEQPDVPATLERLRDLRRVNPNLKVILSIGGWGAEWFSDAALSDASRCRFATSAVALMMQNGLDGLDIDWEYPGQRGAGNRFRAEDKRNFTLLLKAVRDELDLRSKADRRTASNRYTLSVASSGDRYFEFTEMDRLHPYVDWFNVMAYDFFGSGRTTGHHAALAGSPRKSAEAFIAQHLKAGIPAAKIVVGVPFYGKTWRWVNRKSSTGANEPFDQYSGEISYADLQRDFLSDPRYTHGWDAAARAPYLWDPEVGTFVSYDDERSIATKARYVKEHNLGGIMYWEHRYDPEQTLLTTIYTALHAE